MKKILLGVILTVISFATSAAWPTKDITIIVPFLAGGPLDKTTRIIQKDLQERLKVTVTVVNMPGANAGVAANRILALQNDGYTFLVTTSDFVDSPENQKTQLYKKFTPTNTFIKSPLLIYSNGKAENIVDKFKQQIKSGATITVGNAGTGATWLSLITSPLKIISVPYKGSNEVIMAVMGEQIDYGSQATGSVLQLVKEKQLTPVMVSSQQRLPQLPNTPTFKELGITGPTHNVWWGFWARADTDPKITTEFSTAVYKSIAASPDIQEMNNQGFVVMNLNQQQSQAYLSKRDLEQSKLKE